jgi:hypothetical protein
MQIYGTTTTTPKLFLESKNASFTKNSISKFSISSNNVGEVKLDYLINILLINIFWLKIQRIIIGHEGSGKINDWDLKTLYHIYSYSSK